MTKSKKSILSWILIFTFLATAIPLESFAAIDINVKNFFYTKVDVDGSTKEIIIQIKGTNFKEYINGIETDVVTGIVITTSTGPYDITKIKQNGGDVKISSSNIIDIKLPNTFPSKILEFELNTKYNQQVIFNPGLETQPSIETWVSGRILYLGDPFEVQGQNFDGVNIVNIAGGDNIPVITTTTTGSSIKVNTIVDANLGGDNFQSVSLIKQKIILAADVEGQTNNISTSLIVEYRNRVKVYSKLPGLDNLRVMPSFGPRAGDSLISVEALNSSGQISTGVLKEGMGIYLRDPEGEKPDIKLNDIRVMSQNGQTVAIRGYTPRNSPNVELYNNDNQTIKKYHVIIKELNASGTPTNREAVKYNSYNFIDDNPNPIITSISPTSGPDKSPEGKRTVVTVVGKNIIKVNTPGISFNNSTITPKSNGVSHEDSDKTLIIDYDISGTPNYGIETNIITGIKRKLKATIVYPATFKKKPDSTPLDLVNTDILEANYGNEHFTTGSRDGIVIIAPNVSNPGNQPVILEVETILTYKDKDNVIHEIAIPEGTRYEFFKYVESSPTPVVTTIEPVYGYYHNVLGIQKPLMVRVTGSNFQAIRDANNVIKYPQILIYDSEDKPLAAEVSYEVDDIKILKDGIKIDGKDITLGNTMIFSIKPTATGDLKPQVLQGSEVQSEFYSKRDVKISIINPEGNEFKTAVGKFEFRHPTDTNSDTSPEPHLRQPLISELLIEGVKVDINSPTNPVKISSLKEGNIEIKVDRDFGFTDITAKQLKVTIDGKYITQNITATNEGNSAVIKLKVPTIFAGKTRLQVIANEGLMDSIDVVFDSLQGPEIASINPNVSVAGSIMVIKREVTGAIFRKPNPTGKTELERIGSRVKINSEDINTKFNGYQKDASGNVIYVDNEIFNPDPAQELLLPAKYVYVVDENTIYLKIPEGVNPGKYNIVIANPDSGESSRAYTIEIKPDAAPLKIGEINPDKDGKDGGIIATIKAGDGTNFNGGVDVYIGSQVAQIIGYNLDFTEVYIKVPPLVDFKFPSDPQSGITSFSVPVTLQRTTTKVSDTKINGFTYTNEGTSINTLIIYKDGMKPTDTDANKVKSGDFIWIESSKAIFKGVLNDQGEVDETKNPKVLIGNEVLEIDSYVIDNKFDKIVEFKKIKVKVPPRPYITNSDGSVDVMVLNHDGSKETKEKGIIYTQNNPEIDPKSVLKARRMGERIEVYAKNIVNDNLIVAFGDKTYTGNLESTAIEILAGGKGELENILVKFNPNSEKNIEVYYVKPNNELVLMEDLTILDLNTGAETLTNGKLDIGDKAGKTVVVGINWKNPDYHQSTKVNSNPDLVKQFNKEYMYIRTIQIGSNNFIEVRRALGKVENFKIDKANNSTIGILTPYYDDQSPLKSTITLMNSDGSSATAGFEFHSGQDAPVITDLEGSKERTITIDVAPQKVKVKTQDYTVDGTMKIVGKFFKDVQSVKIGTKDVKIESISPDYTYMIVSVPKADPAEVGQPLQVTVVTKEGNAFSSKTVPPVYFMYIAADSKPIIETITPVVGPRTGGTLVTITGKGFREKDEFGIISDKIEERITITINGSVPAGLKSTTKNELGEIVELKVIIPPSVTGKAKLQIINADGGTSEPKEFTYISQPKISKTEGSIFFNDLESTVKLLGEDFQSGAKVIIGAQQTKGKKPADTKISGMIEVTSDGQNQLAYLTGGVEAADVKVTGTNQITFKMPAGIESLDNVDIIIVNPDTGMSGPSTGTIKPPIPDVPTIEATPGFERSIILRWTVNKEVLNAAEKFEIYVKERSANDYTFVGDTKQDSTNQTYVIKGLKYNTSYDIMVRVMNKYGEATDFGEARATTLSQADDYKEKEKQDAVDKKIEQIVTEGKQEIIGDTLYYTVGSKETNINLTNTTAKNRLKYVQIPVKDVKAGKKTIIITDKDITVSINYNALNVESLKKAPDDALLRILISTADKKIEEGLLSAIPRNLKLASNLYVVDFELVEPKITTPISSLASSATLVIKGNAYPKYHAVYIESADTFSILQSNSITQGGYYVLLTNKQ